MNGCVKGQTFLEDEFRVIYGRNFAQEAGKKTRREWTGNDMGLEGSYLCV